MRKCPSPSSGFQTNKRLQSSEKPVPVRRRHRRRRGGCRRNEFELVNPCGLLAVGSNPWRLLCLSRTCGTRTRTGWKAIGQTRPCVGYDECGMCSRLLDLWWTPSTLPFFNFVLPPSWIVKKTHMPFLTDILFCFEPFVPTPSSPPPHRFSARRRDPFRRKLPSFVDSVDWERSFVSINAQSSLHHCELRITCGSNLIVRISRAFLRLSSMDTGGL